MRCKPRGFLFQLRTSPVRAATAVKSIPFAMPWVSCAALGTPRGSVVVRIVLYVFLPALVLPGQPLFLPEIGAHELWVLEIIPNRCSRDLEKLEPLFLDLLGGHVAPTAPTEGIPRASEPVAEASLVPAAEVSPGSFLGRGTRVVPRL